MGGGRAHSSVKRSARAAMASARAPAVHTVRIIASAPEYFRKLANGVYLRPVYSPLFTYLQGKFGMNVNDVNELQSAAIKHAQDFRKVYQQDCRLAVFWKAQSSSGRWVLSLTLACNRVAMPECVLKQSEGEFHNFIEVSVEDQSVVLIYSLSRVA